MIWVSHATKVTGPWEIKEGGFVKGWFWRTCPHSGFRSRGTCYRSEKLQNESSPNFLNCRPGFCPEFCSGFSPKFSRIFRASFRRRRRPENVHQTSPPFSMQNSEANTFFWRAGKVRTCERALVPVFVPGEHLNVPSFRFSFRGHIRQNHPFPKDPSVLKIVRCSRP